MASQDHRDFGPFLSQGERSQTGAMKKYAVALAFLLVASGCGGSSDTATPATTATTTAVPTTTIQADSTAPATTTDAPTTTSASQAGLTAACTFDESVPKISCHAVGFLQGSQLRWESNVYGWQTGTSYEVELVEQYQLVPEAIVTLQQCQGSDCESVTTTIDMSAIAQTPSTTGDASSQADKSAPESPASSADLVRNRWGYTCEGSGAPRLSVAPIDVEQLDFIKPLGALSSSHTLPVSHQYWYPDSSLVADIRSPVSGHIIALANRGEANTEGSFGGSTGEGYEVQYVIQASCDFYVILDHVVGVPAAIVEALGSSRSEMVRIPVSAGELLGQHPDGLKTDVSVVDLTRGEIDGFIDPDSYYEGQYGEVFKLYERDSFEYFDEPLRTRVAEKSLRELEPRGGFFAYDIEGTAQGSWFREGTNGFVGNPETQLDAYWAGHLALIPDHIEVSKIRVSVGDEFRGRWDGRQWGVSGDTPAFKTVTVASGLTKYELRGLLPCDGSGIHATGRSRAYMCNQESIGVLLIELTDELTMRVEVFFQAELTDILSFSGNARTYVRNARTYAPGSE